MEEGKYIYCIVSENKKKNFGYIGINNRQVNLLHYRDIAAVVSNTPIINFDRLDKKELTNHVAVHQKVQEQLMKDYDVVPMSFGIIAPSVDEVLHILERAYLQFKTALKKITDKAEFVVQVRGDQKKLLEEVIKTNPEIQKLKQQIVLKGDILGIPTKLKLGKLIEREIEIQRQVFIKDIQTSLNSCSDDFASNKLIEDEMLANFSFLIEKYRESDLDRKMAELGKKYEGKLRFKYIGPMPPYSFVNINLSLGNFELVNQARKLLGLDQEATFDEIKKAYYALASQYHPDKHLEFNPPTTLKYEEQMKKIAQAYTILENYCQSCDGFMGKKENRKYSFKEEDVKDSVMIK